MTIDDLILDGKYIPLSKSVGCSLHSSVWRDALLKSQHFLYYRGTRGGEYMFSENANDIGDFFTLDDMIVYTEHLPSQTYNLMTGENLIIGQKYRIKSKSVGQSFEESNVLRRRKPGQDYLYFLGMKEDGILVFTETFQPHYNINNSGGDHFLITDIEGYYEPDRAFLKDVWEKSNDEQKKDLESKYPSLNLQK